ncbi:NEQ126a [Nanoarchaeum equitans Kin4-M]|uniref:NEQ126a n=1 Tax=Nanoarchaeum equitans (strain Kin4-M) TaxID=228908 RepID=Q74N88_NANEQ|nr:NEQ126a [Nanoarchaeum equitans Kin4-M]
MKSYLLLIYLPRDTEIKTKAKKFFLKKGYYVYVGSMKIGIKRVIRHFKKNKKKHWHIDFLLEKAQPIFAILLDLEEKELSKLMENYGKPIEGFGNTDLDTKSNLFFLPSNEIALDKQSIYITIDKIG